MCHVVGFAKLKTIITYDVALGACGFAGTEAEFHNSEAGCVRTKCRPIDGRNR